MGEKLQKIRAFQVCYPHIAASTIAFFKSSTPPPQFYFRAVTWAIMSDNPSQLVSFDETSHTFVPYRPNAETRSRNTRHVPNTFVRPSLPGEAVHDFMVAAQPNQHQANHSGNGGSTHFQQRQSSNRGGLQQHRDYTDFENGQLVNPPSDMRGAFHTSGAGQMLPPVSLSQTGLAMVNHAHPTHSDGFAILPSPTEPFQQQVVDMVTEPVDPSTSTGFRELRGFKMIPDPPHLDYWRERLFNVDELITLSEDEYVDSIDIVDCLTSIVLPLQTQANAQIHHYTDSIHTSRMLTTYIPIAQLSGTSANPSFLTIGTVD